METVSEFVGSVPDFRRKGIGNFRHRLNDVLALDILARLSGCRTRPDVIDYGRRNIKRFRRCGMLRSGVPSEATLCRMFKNIDDEAMARCMRDVSLRLWKERPSGGMDIVCVDGKAMKGTAYENGKNPDIVSAYSCCAALTLATDICDKKSNEITSVPRLLDKLDIKGCVVTADAMSCQKDIIDKIRKKRGDFLIELKANQRSLRYNVEDRIKSLLLQPADCWSEGPALDHGRIETRACRTYDGEALIVDKEKWKGRITIVEVTVTVTRKSTGAVSEEKRYYITSLPADDAKTLCGIARRHWSIESLHWTLDRNLRQDSMKRKSARSARNLDTIQRFVLNLISAWRNRRKKRADKAKGVAQIIRMIARSFTELMRFLSQK